jgi:hypothetical protein
MLDLIQRLINNDVQHLNIPDIYSLSLLSVINWHALADDVSYLRR